MTHRRFRTYNTAGNGGTGGINLAMAVRAGNRVWLRGQTGLDLDGNFVGTGDAAAQAENAMRCVEVLLKEAGSELGHIVKTTIYLVDRGDRDAVYDVVGRWLRGVHPCQTGLIVAGLARPELLAAIDAYLATPQEASGETETEGPTLDIEGALERLMVPEDFLRKILVDYVGKYADVTAELRRLLDGGADEDAERLAHSLKGVSGTLGAERVQDAAAALEAAIGEARDDDIAAGLDALDQKLKPLVRDIEAYLAS